MSKFETANHWIDVAVKRAGSVSDVNRPALKAKIRDHYVATLALAGAGRADKASVDEAVAGLHAGVGPLVDKRLRSKCVRTVHVRRLESDVPKVAANAIRRGKVDSSIKELVHMTGHELADSAAMMSAQADHFTDGANLRLGARIYFRKTDTDLGEELIVALEKDGVSEEEFYEKIAV